MTAPHSPAPSGPPPADDIAATVRRALAEDVGTGDVTAGLVDAGVTASGRVRCKEPAVLCGTAWFDEVYRQVDASVTVTWHYADGDEVPAGTAVCAVSGPARGILTGERTALNFLQTLSGTATAAHQYAAAVAGTATRVLDTRKTLPGLRRAQKYAVRCGGAHNHRQGLYDAVLIKENHIAAAGGIAAAVERAVAAAPGLMVEIEVETLDELREALATDVHRIMLDDFTLQQLREAVAIRDAGGTAGASRKELEASGSVDLDTLRALAETGVDYVSIGAMTKNVQAIDFSLRLDE